MAQFRAYHDPFGRYSPEQPPESIERGESPEVEQPNRQGVRMASCDESKPIGTQRQSGEAAASPQQAIRGSEVFRNKASRRIRSIYQGNDNDPD